MDMRAIKPRPGLEVHDPAKAAALPADGATVAWDSWWQRRLDDGDVEYLKDKKGAAK